MHNLDADIFNPIKSIQLFGYNEYFNNLIKLQKIKKLPKVILLSGEKGLGKFTFAFHFVNFFFSNQEKNSYDNRSYKININNDFYKKVLSNVNENYNYIGKQDAKKVSIDTIRDIKKKFFSTSLNNKARFTIIDDCELLNINSANALLKLIEEPTDLNYFILINNKRKKIIETLKSRSIEFKIFIKNKERENILNNLTKIFSLDLSKNFNFINKFTPGNLLRISYCLNESKIENYGDLYNCTDILLDKFKKNKNEVYLETIKFLIDIYIDKFLHSKNYNMVNINFLRKNLTKRLIEFENFNLSKNLILETFKNFPNHA